MHCGSIGGRKNGIISSNNSQCLVNLALMRHLLMAVEFGAGDSVANLAENPLDLADLILLVGKFLHLADSGFFSGFLCKSL